MKKALFLLFAGIAVAFTACKKDKDEDPKLIFKFKFDPTQARLNNFGQPATVPSGNATQTPAFNAMSAHYIELTPGAATALGAGAVLYKAAEVTTGGDNAIDFSKSNPVGSNTEFFSIPLKDVPPGSYEWIRVSLAYQNYDINFRIKNPLDTTQVLDLTGTLASFIGYNTYLTSYKIKNQTIQVNDDKKQGYWGFETSAFGQSFTTTGQAAAGATTVVNPLFASSPIPAGSCVVTGAFDQKLEITGEEKSNIIVTISLSINESFEWNDTNSPDGKYQPDKGDFPVDMGVRGMIPSWTKE
ncbi:MAG: hypothetical protein ACT6QS_14095 [Flavobacteriales bacterium]